MAIEINNLASTNLISDIKSRQKSVPSENLVNDTTNNASTSQLADNIIPLGSVERQRSAGTANITEQTQENSNKNLATDSRVNEISRSVQTIQRNLEFRIDDASGRTVITVKDTDSQKVIRQIPSDQLLELSARLKEIESQKRSNVDVDAQGVLFTSKT